ncbi:MAG: TlpA family protein disulfide reductase [Magnetococcales bacterium]|nr:TlpA family protein disulfide reductase [Magnetococcales bacterium]
MMKRRVIALFMLMFMVSVVHAEEAGGLNTPLTTTNGKTMRLTDLKGKVVLVNFWATWCPPCLEEIPALVQLQTQYADRGLVVVGIDYMEKADAKRLNQFIDEQGINYPVVMGDMKTLQGVAKTLGGVFALPVTKVLDRNGKVAASHIGGLNFAEMKKLVEPLL